MNQARQALRDLSREYGMTLPATNELELGRQALRRLGFTEIRRQCRLKFPLYNRKQVNQLARQLQEAAWERRDKEAVKRFLHGDWKELPK